MAILDPLQDHCILEKERSKEVKVRISWTPSEIPIRFRGKKSPYGCTLPLRASPYEWYFGILFWRKEEFLRQATTGTTSTLEKKDLRISKTPLTISVIRRDILVREGFMDIIDPLDNIRNPKDITVKEENRQREGFYDFSMATTHPLQRGRTQQKTTTEIKRRKGKIRI